MKARIARTEKLVCKLFKIIKFSDVGFRTRSMESEHKTYFQFKLCGDTFQSSHHPLDAAHNAGLWLVAAAAASLSLVLAAPLLLRASDVSMQRSQQSSVTQALAHTQLTLPDS